MDRTTEEGDARVGEATGDERGGPAVRAAPKAELALVVSAWAKGWRRGKRDNLVNEGSGHYPLLRVEQRRAGFYREEPGWDALDGTALGGFLRPWFQPQTKRAIC